MIPEITKKKKLQTAIKKSLKLALIEMDIVGDGYSEESLRYIVMNQISEQKIWGSFPNNSLIDEKLLFEKIHHTKKRKKSGKSNWLRPDIVSISSDKSLLAIELKISSGNYDIDKCKEYLKGDRDNIKFDLAAAVYATPRNVPQASKGINRKTWYSINKGIKIENSKLLVAYVEWVPKNNRVDEYAYSKIRLVWI